MATRRLIQLLPRPSIRLPVACAARLAVSELKRSATACSASESAMPGREPKAQKAKTTFASSAYWTQPSESTTKLCE